MITWILLSPKETLLSPHFFEKKWENFYASPTFFVQTDFLKASQASTCGIKLKLSASRNSLQEETS